MPITTYSGIVQILNKQVTKAVEMTANQMQEKLKECIQEKYYDEYSPILYERTNKFLNSAVAKMLGQSSASIGIDEAYFDYQYPTEYTLRDGSQGNWTGEDQVVMGMHGYHGTAYIQTEGRFWDEFLEWANENAVELLRENLLKCGIPVIK